MRHFRNKEKICLTIYNICTINNFSIRKEGLVKRSRKIGLLILGTSFGLLSGSNTHAQVQHSPKEDDQIAYDSKEVCERLYDGAPCKEVDRHGRIYYTPLITAPAHPPAPIIGIAPKPSGASPRTSGSTSVSRGGFGSTGRSFSSAGG